ncbi:hypothetical protein L1856_06770 [Streptomyces sp. Tue 6430]|nr:hypothetical protein [Streptomyces sp. Tue 6430]
MNESLLVLTSPQDDTGAHWSRTRPPALSDPHSGPAPDVIAADDDTVPEAPLSEVPLPEAPPLQAPPSEDARRRWVAGQVGAEDLPGNPPGFTGTEIVTLAELRDAGVEITPGMDVEAQLGGGVRGSGLAPRDQVRLLLARPGPWPDPLDAVAATVSRRLWRSALTDFESTAPDPDAARAAWVARAAWDTALGLLLPGERDSVLADWRYAGEAFRDAVRRLAVLLAAEGTDPGRSRASPPCCGRGSDCRPPEQAARVTGDR